MVEVFYCFIVRRVVTRVSSVFVVPAGCCSMSRLEAIVSVCYYSQVSLAA
jgi:hypothetical protein